MGEGEEPGGSLRWPPAALWLRRFSTRIFLSVADSTDRLNAALSDRYRIQRELGEGGMATVYLADDLKHDRKVAIKVLKPELAAVIGGERFVAEIRTTAGLQHPHILPLFDSGEADGFLYYVMPYVEGESLRDRLDREKQLGVDEALALTRDVADALDYAHRQGVIHRDIKPANILLQDGRPVVSDFGIALAISAAGGGRMTETGLSLGTPHYMSPEQATADRDLTGRSDVYGLACVLYEMLAGDPPHTGPTSQAVVVRILTETPRPVSDTRTTVPPHVDAVLMKALEKLPADRFESAAEFKEALDRTDFTHRPVRRTRPGGEAPPESSSTTTAAPPGPVARGLPWGVAAVAVGLLIASRLATPSEDPATWRLDLDLSGLVEEGDVPDIAVSPDGSLIALSKNVDGERALYVRATDEADFRKLPGTEGGLGPTFSPDGEWIAFTDTEGGTLRKITVSGGGATTLVDEENGPAFIPHWGQQDRIVFSNTAGVHIASATSGSADDLVTLTTETVFGVHLLPDGSGVLANLDGGIAYYEVEGDSSWTVVPEGLHAKYLSTGHLLYTSADGGLFAVPFDVEERSVTGTPVRVLDRVATGAFRSGGGYAVSRSGVLVYAEGEPALGRFAREALFVTVYPDGRTEPLPLRPAPRFSPSYSPDGRFLAYVAGVFTETNVFTYDLLTGDEERLTTEGDNWAPVWSPDGAWLIFASRRDGTNDRDLFVAPADNRRPEQRVDSLPGWQYPYGWLSDGRILFTRGDGRDPVDVLAGTLAQDDDEWRLDDVTPYLEAPWDEEAPNMSPDGSLVAYLSDRTGSLEVWLATWPEPTGQYRVTRREAGFNTENPRWAPDGSAIYFLGNGPEADTLFAAPVESDPLRAFAPEPVLSLPELASGWDVHPEGDRFLMTVPATSAAVGGSDDEGDDRVRYFVVVNWLAELQRKLEGG